jgi:hypothetical protein
MVVSVFNAASSYREKSGRIFRGHPRRYAFGSSKLRVCCFHNRLVVLIKTRLESCRARPLPSTKAIGNSAISYVPSKQILSFIAANWQYTVSY